MISKFKRKVLKFVYFKKYYKDKESDQVETVNISVLLNWKIAEK